MQFVDKALARRFEACEEMPQVLYARVFQKTRPGIGAAEEEICGGHMVFAGLGSPIGRATGLGLDPTLTAEDVDRVEQFYRLHKAPAQVDLCPLHDPAVFEMFKERGYGDRGTEQRALPAIGSERAVSRSSFWLPDSPRAPGRSGRIRQHR